MEHKQLKTTSYSLQKQERKSRKTVMKTESEVDKVTAHLTHYSPVLLFYTSWKYQKT